MGKVLARRDKWTRNFMQTFSSQLVIMCVNLLSGVILSRGMGAEGRGQFISITMWSNLLYWALSFGVYQAVLYFMKQHNGQKNDIFRTFLVYTLLTCIIAIVVAETIIVPLVTDGYDTGVIIAARIYFIGIVFAGFADILMATLASEEKFGYSNIIRMLIPGFTTLIMLVLFFLDILTAQTALYTSFITSSCLFLVNVFKMINLKYIGGKVDWPLMWQAFKYGAKSHGGSVAGLASNNSSQMTISVFLSSASLGLYSTAQSSVSPLNTITSTIGITAQPMLTAEEKNKVHLRVVEIIRKTAFVIGICSFALASLLPLAIPIVYGQEFRAAIIPALIILPSVMFNSISNTFRNALNGAGMTFINTKAEIIVLVFTAVFLFVFLSRWQLEGAAIATTLSSVVRCIIFYNEYKRRIYSISVLEMIPTWKDAKGIYASWVNLWNKRLNKATASKG
ncbi:oligosaccharide flippase family protein [Paenibacillus sp. BR1-192]|uniref:lipopolysaccharide biosynthesis protein n=1 Tax=Paenibacillus sp. BR1-192 TaxID=3032287 RepID=UPI00240E93F0|nr:oligosaccharide flippase family protein [Paenibacillus sp. BR1-192]WFB58916.1 oligosaccharide flippase family protein [Paenibacillus sp. BR1-192]